MAKLGDSNYAMRERATADLLALGTKVVPVLRQSTPTADLEHKRRIENCLTQIADRQDKDKLPHAAARLLAIRKPAGATEAMLAYLGSTEDEVMGSEIASALKSLAVVDGKPNPGLLKAVQDKMPLRRAVAGEVLASVKGADAETRAAVRKLLTGAVPTVRLRAALALARTGDKEAVPVLIDMVDSWSSDEQVCLARELLRRLAGANAPHRGRLDTPVPPEKYRAAWKAWWEEHAATVDLAQLESAVLRKANVFSARASNSWEERGTPGQAFDNSPNTDQPPRAWNSGGYAPQWIEADLRASRRLDRILLVATPSYTHEVPHEVWIANEPIGDDLTKAKLVHTFQRQTQDADVLTFTFPKQVSGRYVQIRTTKSRNWVAWHQIELRVR